MWSLSPGGVVVKCRSSDVISLACSGWLSMWSLSPGGVVVSVGPQMSHHSHVLDGFQCGRCHLVEW